MILIHSAGNDKIGIGNLSRCRTLAFQIHKFFHGKLAVVYETSEKLMDKFYVPEAINFRAKNRMEAKNIIQEIVEKCKEECNVIVTDLLDLSYEDNVYYKNRGFDCIVHLNDWNVCEYKPDILISGDAFLHKWDIDDKTIVFEGPKYHMVRPEIVKLRPELSWNKKDINDILVCFGGSDPAYYTELLVKTVYNNPVYLSKNFNVILGPAFSDDRIKAVSKYKSNNINYIKNPTSVGKVILNNDLIITLGGITSYEAMCLGIPVAAIEWKYMKYYVQRLDKDGIIVDLGYGIEGIRNIESLFCNVDKLKFISHTAWKMIDGNGAERVAKLICSLLRKFK
ncbi:hypothetical protein CLTEP_12890 [Clostridium tepidiprofundi DSM 19306]|uniref:UDP-2,4-diacetamido-2,4, 6-trideoxy-beta-L-altropyranose hydrolase n=1 Tax=Clostridium tepidiprofundi DSM 19306 TaxID=1121338 RepID=A0A151B4H6_9CLOT|nr:hypothetical protein [Clostridium tepidiprofundi]KYH34824.1 hypothetical protein CLTEP_12890 [Clostridium tepidiprofundi DSM 19306]